MERISISDGVSLNIIKTDKFKTDYISFNFVTQLKKETASYNALIPQVLMRGTEKHPDLASIKNALDDLYAASVEGRIYKRGEYQVCGITGSWLADKYAIDGTAVTEGSLDMLEELIFEPFTKNGVFAEGYVENEKNNLIDDIRAIINNKTGYAVRRCQEEMCKDESFGICEYGDESSVRAITPAELYGAYKRLLSEASVEIFYVGSYDAQALTARVAEMFKGRERSCVALEKPLVKRSVTEVKNVTESISAVQGKLSLGFRTGRVLGEADYKALPVLVELYANSTVSKLFLNVREKLSLCYYCRAIPEGMKGIMIVTSGIEVANKEKAQNEILYQLEKVKKGEFTDEELVLAKKSLKNAYSELTDSPAALEGWYLTRRLAGVYDDPMQVCESFMQVTREDVVKAAEGITLDTVYFLEGTLAGEGEDEDDE